MHSKAHNSYSLNQYGLSSDHRPLSLIKSVELLTTPKPTKLKFSEPKPLKPIQTAIFELHGVGLNYNPYAGIGLPYGSGFLISPSLILTTNKNIPSAEHAHIALLKFPSLSQSTLFRLNPNTFFFTNFTKNFTIVAVVPNPKLFTIPQISPKSKFKLFKSAPLRVLTPSLVTGLVKSVTQTGFLFSCPGSLLPGVPIFDENWKVQGVYLGQENKTGSKFAFRIDIVLETLLQNSSLTLHRDLEDLIGKVSSIPSFPVLKTRLGDLKELYWARAGHWTLYHLNLGTKAWELLELTNISEFRKVPGWTFKQSSRLISLPDNSFLLIGGIDPDIKKPANETLQIFPTSCMMKKKISMQEGRAEFSLVYRSGFVYAIGGSLRELTCERYSVLSDRWEPIGDLNKSRYNASATLFANDKFIMVIGGEGHSGKSIERYSFQFDKWEVLSVVLPNNFINPGLFVFDNHKIAVLGGKASEMVLVVELDTYVKENINKVQEEVFRTYQVDILPSKLVCFTQALFVWNRGILYFINESQSPEIFEYPVKKLGISGMQPLAEFKNLSQSGGKVLNTNRLLTPDYFDGYF